MQYFKEFCDFVEKHHLEKPIGCSEDDISELEGSLGCELPDSYKEYLRLMGRDYSGVMVGTNCFVSDVLQNNECLPELLNENQLSGYIPQKKYVAFFCHQGYMMSWFTIPCEESDPQCTYYFEGTTEIPEVYGTFSEFMKKDVLGNAKLRVANEKHEKKRQKWWCPW